jgi:hypothetical protein
MHANNSCKAPSSRIVTGLFQGVIENVLTVYHGIPFSALPEIQ